MCNKKTIGICDDELITPTESYILNALLEKVADSGDMANMEILDKASELLELINNS